MNAELVLLNARIATMDAAGGEAQALAAFGGRIAAIGDSAAMRDLIGPGTRVVDAGGRRVIPGIVDSQPPSWSSTQDRRTESGRSAGHSARTACATASMKRVRPPKSPPQPSSRLLASGERKEWMR